MVLLLTASGASAATVMVTGPPYNAKGNGVAQDRAALQQALASGNSVYVPAGTYLVDNSAGPLVVSNFSATLEFSPLAAIACTMPSRACLIFNGGNSPTFTNVHVTYATRPVDDCRSGQSMCVTLLFDGQNSPVIRGTVVENGWAVGVSVNNTTNAQVTNTIVRHTTRDGLFLQDNQAISVNGVVVTDAGDDCFGFHVTPAGAGRSGGTASGITCKAIRGGGLVFAGGANLSVSDFVIDGTSAQGIYVISDPDQGYLVPSNITVAHGVIRGVGSVADNINRKGTQHGIQYYTTSGQKIGAMRFSDVVIDGVSGYGIYGLSSESATFTDVHISNSGLDGLVSNASCAMFAYNGNLSLSRVSARECYRVGILAIQNTAVTVDSATVTNAWRKGALESGAKAFDIVANNSVLVTNVAVVDQNNPASGYTFNENQNSSGAVNGVYFQVPYGSPTVVHGSSSVSFVK